LHAAFGRLPYRDRAVVNGAAQRLRHRASIPDAFSVSIVAYDCVPLGTDSFDALILLGIRMGEAKRKRSATQRLIEAFPDCCFCGGIRRAVTREHMPPKALFDRSHRPDKLIMPACDECNRGTSASDLIASILSRWGYDFASQDHADHRRLVAQARIQVPGLIDEWTQPINKLRARRHLERHGVPVPQDAAFATIGPLTIRQLNLFSYKVVLGLYFECLRTILPNAGRVAAFWRSKEDFAKEGIPPELLDLMKRHGTLEQGRWNTSEIFEYRYEVNQSDGLFACLARLRNGLFVSGFAARDAAMIAHDTDGGWIEPSHLLGILTNPAFERRP